MTDTMCETCGRRLFLSENLFCHHCVQRERIKEARERDDTERSWQRLKEAKRRLEFWKQHQ